METKEHTALGNLIRIETYGNPYLEGSTGLSEDAQNILNIQLMRLKNNIPLPLGIRATAGEIIALAGDYYTKAGWGLSLNIYGVRQDNQKLAQAPVHINEKEAFLKAYEDIASPERTRADFDYIYKIDNSWLPSLLKEMVYALTIKDYSRKLENNEAHFSPWSLRAYLVGHSSALEMAKLSYFCFKFAEGQGCDIEELKQALAAIKKSPEEYQFKQGMADQDIWRELGHRYHALAVAYDLFTLHFYTDHFAGGHLDFIGKLREEMPKKFGFLGSVLINCMHNEYNQEGVKTSNSFMAKKWDSKGLKTHGKDNFHMLKEDSIAYGDGTYFKRANDANADAVVNGADNSLGDIVRVIEKGDEVIPELSEYGGLTFLPEIDRTKPQPQPLLIKGEDGEIYYRSDISTIQQLDTNSYQNMLEEPLQNGYEKLTWWNSVLLVIKLRVLGYFYSPVVKQDKLGSKSLEIIVKSPVREELACEEYSWERSQQNVAYPSQVGMFSEGRGGSNHLETAVQEKPFLNPHPSPLPEGEGIFLELTC